jgi:hypothetical protein
VGAHRAGVALAGAIMSACRLCNDACEADDEFCRPCALDLALIGMYERIAEWPMLTSETGDSY